MRQSLMPALLLAILVRGIGAAEVEVTLVPYASGMSRIVAMTFAPGNPETLFVTQQGGKVRVVRRAVPLDEPFLDISSRVSCCGERGLLSIAFHPSFQANGQFFVNYIDRDGNTVVARYSVSAADPLRADPGSEDVLLRIVQPFTNHNGGQLQFGPDGYLYIATGDGGSADDPQNNAQNPQSLLGKMLRIDVDGRKPYAIPPSNPFTNSLLSRPEIWATGLRNPWRFSFDRATGDLYIGDVGQSRFEEVNRQPSTSRGGENYGWRLMEGNACNVPPIGCSGGGLTRPIIVYAQADDPALCAVTGGYVYRGRSKALQGVYFYGDFCAGRVWGAKEVNGVWRNVIDIDTNLSVSAFGEDLSGEVYVLHYFGTIYRIVDRNFERPRPARR